MTEVPWASAALGSVKRGWGVGTGWGGAHHEVEVLCFLLVSPSLGDAGLTQVGFRHSGLHRLSGAAVLEALGHIIVLNSDHILDCLEGGFSRFLDLEIEKHSSH